VANVPSVIENCSNSPFILSPLPNIRWANLESIVAAANSYKKNRTAAINAIA
jgi:hypothetical protein